MFAQQNRTGRYAGIALYINRLHAKKVIVFGQTLHRDLRHVVHKERALPLRGGGLAPDHPVA